MKKIWVEKAAYLDSVTLMVVSKRVSEARGVRSALVAMATDTNLALLKESGFSLDEAASATANDIMIAVDAEDAAALEAGLALARQQIQSSGRSGSGQAGAARARAHRGVGAGEHRGAGAPGHPSARPAGSDSGGAGGVSGLESALREHPEINLVLISVPGRFAAYEAYRALRGGRHVMIFSDNVALADEKRLKALGEAKGLLVMGPDCGTAIISGVGLGFANAVPRGRVGIVSASGTGAQEVSAILGRMGVGVSHIIGTGGRDVSEAVGGVMTKAGLKALNADGGTGVIVIISKVPSEAVAKEILATATAGGKPCIVYFAGATGGPSQANVSFSRTLTDAALEAATAVGHPRSSLICAGAAEEKRLASHSKRLPSSRKYVRGLYSGGTLAQEAVFIFGQRLGRIATNMKLPGTARVDDPSVSSGHTVIDLGDDAFTRGRAHPMIDQAYRLVRLRRELADPQTAVILMDVVLGHGCNSDPAGEIAGVLRDAAGQSGASARDATGPVVIASVCGTADDPQRYDTQKQKLESQDVMVAPTNAIAAKWALDLVERR